MKKKKNWLKFDVRIEGVCEATRNGNPWIARYQAGIAESGRSRVYAGVFVKLIGPDGREWLGQDSWSYLTSLKQIFSAISAEGIELVCAGLDPSWYTTGLSDGSGHGYLRGREDEGAFHVMDQPHRS